MCPLAESVPPATAQTSSECKVFQRYIRPKWKSYPIAKAVLQHLGKGMKHYITFSQKKVVGRLHSDEVIPRNSSFSYVGEYQGFGGPSVL